MITLAISNKEKLQFLSTDNNNNPISILKKKFMISIQVKLKETPPSQNYTQRDLPSPTFRTI